MGTQANKLQYFGVGLSVNQKQVRFEVAFAMISPFAAKSVIAVLVWQRLVFCQK